MLVGFIYVVTFAGVLFGLLWVLVGCLLVDGACLGVMVVVLGLVVLVDCFVLWYPFLMICVTTCLAI